MASAQWVTPTPTDSREPTENELTNYRQGFPLIGHFQVLNITHVRLIVFNCIAWSMGFTDRWLEPGTRAQMARGRAV